MIWFAWFVRKVRQVCKGGRPLPEASGSAGPLTVVRLLRTVLSFLGFFADRECFWSFDGREDFAIGICR